MRRPYARFVKSQKTPQSIYWNLKKLLNFHLVKKPAMEMDLYIMFIGSDLFILKLVAAIFGLFVVFLKWHQKSL